MVTYTSIICSGWKRYVGVPLVYLNESKESEEIESILENEKIKYITPPRDEWIKKPILICRDGYFEGLESIREFLRVYGKSYKE